MKFNKVIRLMAILAFLLTMGVAEAQNDPCGFDKVNKHTPKIMGLSYDNALPNTEKIIPTIIHVIHNGEPYGEGSHISSINIHESIDNLNFAFEGGYSDVMPNSLIEFCLADIGPNGEFVNSIQYHNANDIPGFNGWGDIANDINSNYNMFRNAIAVDDNNYCNVYIAPWYGSPLGFSSLPPSDIGVWVHSDEILDPLSTTLYHEAGHYCGLWHTFTATNLSQCDNPDIDCTTQGDRVCDTPPTIGGYGCPDESPCPGRLVENYMDYTNCKDSFTQGQIDRMHMMLEEGRSDLLLNNVCSTGGIDFGIVGWEDIGGGCGTLIIPEVIMKNYGVAGDYMFILAFQIYQGNTLISTESYNAVQFFEENESLIINFSEFLIEFGEYEVNINLELLSDEDEWPYNDFFSNELLISPTTEFTIDYTPGIFGSYAQFKIIEPGESSSNPLYSCNWGGDTCFANGEAPNGMLSATYCLPEGCYTMLWRFIDPAIFGYCDDCYVDMYTDNGSIFYWDTEDVYPPNTDPQNHITTIDFCIEAYDPCPDIECPLDLDTNNIIGAGDLLILLGLVTSEPECDVGDYNYDGYINGEDVNILISNFGTMCSPELMEKTTINILECKDTYIQETKIFDLFGRELNDKARLTPGIYLVMETWSDGQTKIRKIFLNQ